MELLSNSENIRNICILAHVDHGKTTIADALIASNGIISHRLAGKMRYLDDRQEEQERGITMKSSSIALKYSESNGSKYLINLVDTPGHVDFCGEVSAAVRLCDGALIVVDVVEGICPQTKVAIEQAWKEGIEPILVLNKVDRLILEQQLNETDAYQRLSQLIEQVNAIVATLLTTEIFEGQSNDEEKSEISEKRDKIQTDEISDEDAINICTFDWASATEDMDYDKYHFRPEKNNVIFAGALDDWAFTIESIARVIAQKSKINLSVLKQTLWGDFYLDMKQKKILKNARAKSKKNLFVTMVLESIWRIYDTVYVRKDRVTMEKICQAIGINLSQRDLNHTDARYQVKLIMSKWLNFSNNVLDPIVRLVPSPKGLSSKRVERLLSSNLKRFNQLPEETQNLKSSFLECSASDDSVKIAFVSKLIPFDSKSLPENKVNIIRKPSRAPIKAPLDSQQDSIPQKIGPDDQQESSDPGTASITKEEPQKESTVFIAFARIFSGVLKKGDKLYVLGPRHDPSKVSEDTIKNIDETKTLEDLSLNEHVTTFGVDNLYLLMGRELERVEYVPAGNIIGIRGLEKHLVRTATLSDNIYCPPFNDLHMPATPILRVAIEPKNPLEMSRLTKGLKLLNQADPCVEVALQDTGEHVIIATGEIHLQHCLKDLKERYTNEMDLNVSQPIVSFRETIVHTPKIDMVNETIGDNNHAAMTRQSQTLASKDGTVELYTPNRRFKIQMKAYPLPNSLVDCIIESSSHLRALAKVHTIAHRSTKQLVDSFQSQKIEESMSKLKEALSKTIKEVGGKRTIFQDNFVDRIWSFGPKYVGPNILLANEGLSVVHNLWMRLTDPNSTRDNENFDMGDFIDSIISGFQLATQSGPLCEEPMMGVCFSIVDWSHVETDVQTQVRGSPVPSSEVSDKASETERDNYGPMSGQIISTVKDCCRKAFQAQPQRLMSPMFSCDIRVSSDALGGMYAVLGRRHGRIVHVDMQEGSSTFEIQAFIPVIESLDFVNEIRDQTSGMANPQLIFSHYELIDLNPFWTPTTEEEYALFGDKADTENLARKYMNLVRRRKGLSVHEKIVEHGEKQRTIKRNK